MNVLFICTGNTFRSMSAHFLLANYAKDKKDTSMFVASAGTRGNPYGPYQKTLDELHNRGIDATIHRMRKVTRDIISPFNIIICMTKKHQEVIKKEFSRDSYLFLELAYGKKEDLLDDDESARLGELHDLDAFIVQTVKVIDEAIPFVYERLKKL